MTSSLEAFRIRRKKGAANMIVIDANVAIEVARNSERGTQFETRILQEDKIIAPSLLVSEVANATWKHATFGSMDEKDWTYLFTAALGQIDEFVSDEKLFPEALSEAVIRKHPVYDMLYFVLARRTASPLLTCDHKLAKICHDNGVECIELSDI